ncbi:P2 phage tail completion protein R (GpR) [Chromohalobacter canadensis]|uniref:P2 phage tail completion protein R (GpR) n=1 Tax=Chromohalobacter canadensis TaxID=141389 RepID=A0A285VQZ3_9GAMM|nr:phage tail protein [Chromohalobacter canadensis]SOC56472.1 P2 phage tail completion protein R (GpR) [Chromohalobacter canadensis]
MKKLHLLRTHLINAVPGLARDPDRLLTFVEDGSLEFRRGPNLSHEYQFAAQLVLTDFGDDLDTVVVPLLQWLAEYQPDADPGEAVTFEAEILSNQAVDVALRVRLTERVIAKVDCDNGHIRVDHALPRFERDGCAIPHWQLLIRDAEAATDYTLVAEWGEEPTDGG